MNEIVKLTIDDKEKNAACGKQVRRLGQLVKAHDRSGARPRDLKFLQSAVREVGKMEQYLMGSQRNFIHESKIPLDKYRENDFEHDDLIFMRDEIFFRLKRKDFIEDIVDIEGQPINTFPIESAYLSPFVFEGEICFPVRDAHDKNVLFINKKNERVLPDLADSEFTNELILDDARELKFIKQRFLDNGDGEEMFRLQDLHGEPLTEMMLSLNYFYENGVLYYWDNISRDGYSGYIDADGNHYEKTGLLSRPFRFNDEFCFIRAINHLVAGNFSTSFSVIDNQDISICLPEDIKGMYVENMRKLLCGENTVYIMVDMSTADAERANRLFKFDGQTITEVTQTIDDEKKLINFFLVNDRLVQVYHKSDESDFVVIIEGLKTPVVANVSGMLEDDGNESIVSTKKPINVQGKTGEIFFMSTDENINRLWVDNESITLPQGDYWNLTALDNHLFFVGRETQGEGRKKVWSKECVLWVDGQPTKYRAEKIVRVVQSRGAYYAIALDDGKLKVEKISVD